MNNGSYLRSSLEKIISVYSLHKTEINFIFFNGAKYMEYFEIRGIQSSWVDERKSKESQCLICAQRGQTRHKNLKKF